MPQRYAFGDFVLERNQQRVLRRDGETLALTPRLFGALLLFVENAGELLDKERLMRALWPGLVVDDNSLSQVISGLRRALADDTLGGRYIQTVPRRGFRFIAPVTALPDAAASQQPHPQHEPQPRRRWLQAGLAGGAALGLSGLGIWAWQREQRAAPAAASSLAVLPFKPLLSEGRDPLLEVGMADSLIAHLSTVPGLVVRSIGSVRRYAGPEQDPLRAARELNVAWIVDGSLQRRDDRLRVSARLLHASDGVAAWSGSFDEQITGVFEVQDLISARVAQVLVPTLGAGAHARPALAGLGGTRNTDAYQLYLAASRHAQDMRADGLRRSIALYQQALALDADYALAWVGLAEAHRRSLFGADALPSSAFEPAGLAVQRALALSPNLAEAHTEQAFKRYWFDFDWAGAERGFRGALALNPNIAMARFGLASLLLKQGRADEGFAELRRARELDPMSPVLNTLEASYLFEAGRHEDARARLARALNIAPGFWLGHCVQAVVHLSEQRPDEGIARLRHAVSLVDGNSRPVALLAICLARLGHAAEARNILAELQALATTRYVPPSSLAAIFAALGEASAALDALDRAWLTRDTRLTFLKDDPRLTVLRRQPRFVALLRRLDLDRFGPGLAPL